MDDFPLVSIVIHGWFGSANNYYWEAEIRPQYDANKPLPFERNLNEILKYIKSYLIEYRVKPKSTTIFIWDKDERGHWRHLRTNEYKINDLQDEAELAVLILQWQ
jgi:hypothetical protein